MKCDICGTKIEEAFLNKIKGTYIGRYRKKKAICPACQKKLSMGEIKEKLKIQ